MTIAITANNVRPIGDYISVKIVSNATLTAGDVVYHNGTGLAVADDDASTASANCIGVVLQDAASGKYADVLTIGRVTGWTGLTAGMICYVVDDGKVASSAGSKNFAVGHAISTTDIFVHPFAPVA